jgi:hypothetical protein
VRGRVGAPSEGAFPPATMPPNRFPSYSSKTKVSVTFLSIQLM